MNDEHREIRMTTPRMAEGIRMHMQMKEKFMAVMEEADLPAASVERLEAWLKAWRAGAVRREIQRREEAVRELEKEIEALRKAAEPRAGAEAQR